GCALLCLAGRWRSWPRRTLLLVVLTLGSCWMILCGPATESCTYVLLAPVLAWGLVGGGPALAPSSPRWGGGSGRRGWPAPHPQLVCAAGRGGKDLSRITYGMLVIAVGAGVFGRAASQWIHSLGLQPLGALAFTVGSSILILRALAGAAGRVP